MERLSGGKKLPPAQPILGFLPAEKRQVTHAVSDPGSCRSIAEFLRFVPPATLFPEKLSHDSRYLGTQERSTDRILTNDKSDRNVFLSNFWYICNFILH